MVTGGASGPKSSTMTDRSHAAILGDRECGRVREKCWRQAWQCSVTDKRRVKSEAREGWLYHPPPSLTRWLMGDKCLVLLFICPCYICDDNRNDNGGRLAINFPLFCSPHLSNCEKPSPRVSHEKLFRCWGDYHGDKRAMVLTANTSELLQKHLKPSKKAIITSENITKYFMMDNFISTTRAHKTDEYMHSSFFKRIKM